MVLQRDFDMHVGGIIFAENRFDIEIIHSHRTGRHQTHGTPDAEGNQVAPIVAKPRRLQACHFVIDLRRWVQLHHQHVSTLVPVLVADDYSLTSNENGENIPS